MHIGQWLIGAALLCALSMFPHSAGATTYYVRTDGGTAAQCTGRSDSAYPGHGTHRDCAFNHPFWALQPGLRASNFIPTTVLKAGDTLVIGSGSYMIGFGAPNASNGMCYQPATWGCAIASIPSGTDAEHPTTITGNCTHPPELWGTQRISSIFDVEDAHDIAIKCLDLTDHSSCVEFYRPSVNTGGVTACERDKYPYGNWASNGIRAAGVGNLTLQDLDIHGFAGYGILAGRLSGKTNIMNVTLRANGWGGWSGDLGGNNRKSSNSGVLVFSRIRVLWNGCAETWPTKKIAGCWGQNEGGYGDGFSEAWTGGVWTFKDSEFKHNTQDGLDMLYANGTGSITIDHAVAWQNGGNGIKTSGPATLRNSIVNGYCNNWRGFPLEGDGQSGVSGTMCRADGTAVVMEFNGPGQIVSLKHNTITGNGDSLFIGGGGDAHYSPNSSNLTILEDNILLGQASAIPRNDGRFTALAWYSDAAYDGVTRYRNNIIWNIKHDFCPSGNICKDPLLRNEVLESFDPALSSSSPARGTATDKGNIGAVQ